MYNFPLSSPTLLSSRPTSCVWKGELERELCTSFVHKWMLVFQPPVGLEKTKRKGRKERSERQGSISVYAGRAKVIFQCHCFFFFSLLCRHMSLQLDCATEWHNFVWLKFVSFYLVHMWMTGRRWHSLQANTKRRFIAALWCTKMNCGTRSRQWHKPSRKADLPHLCKTSLMFLLP